jgi:VCBS repeat protein
MIHRPTSLPVPTGLGGRAALLVGLCAVMGCSGGRSKDVTFGGALLPSRARIAAFESTSLSFAASLPEEGRVVVVEGDSLQELSPPAGCSSPLTTQTGDVNADGMQDVMILDSACGGWLAVRAQGGSWRTEAWERYLPLVPPAHYLFFQDLDGDGDPDVASATPAAVHGFTRIDAETWQAFEMSVPAPNVNPLMARDIALVTRHGDQTVLAVQQPGQLTLLRPSEPSRRPAVLAQINLELLKAYEGFDQLSALPAIEGCDSFALGVGFFVDSGRAPKPLVRLGFLADGFEAARIATQGEQVIAVALVSHEDREFVGLIEGSEGGFSLEVLERTSCSGFETRVFQRISFDVEGVVALADTPEELAASSGEAFLARVVDGRLLFGHFDGVRLRRFEVDPVLWSINETIATL